MRNLIFFANIFCLTVCIFGISINETLTNKKKSKDVLVPQRTHSNKKIYTIEELISDKFAFGTSNDADMDPCKAGKMICFLRFW